MNKTEHVIESLKLVYESVASIPAAHQEVRGEAIAYLLSQAWITQDTATCLGAISEADIIKSQIALLQQDLAKTKNLKARFRLTDKLASTYEMLFSTEDKLEDEYRGRLEIIADELSSAQPEATDFIVDDLVAEATKLETELEAIQKQITLLCQELDVRPDKSQDLVQRLTGLQESAVALDRSLFYKRQAISLNRLGQPRRLKKKRLALEISHLESVKFLNELVSHSLDRSHLVLKIRRNLARAIADAAVAISQPDPVRQSLLLPQVRRIDWW